MHHTAQVKLYRGFWYAVWMAESGRPMSEIAQYLGHSDSQITETVYARYSPHYLRRAAAALEMPTGFRTQFY